MRSQVWLESRVYVKRIIPLIAILFAGFSLLQSLRESIGFRIYLIGLSALLAVTVALIWRQLVKVQEISLVSTVQ